MKPQKSRGEERPVAKTDITLRTNRPSFFLESVHRENARPNALSFRPLGLTSTRCLCTRSKQTLVRLSGPARQKRVGSRAQSDRTGKQLGKKRRLRRQRETGPEIADRWLTGDAEYGPIGRVQLQDAERLLARPLRQARAQVHGRSVRAEQAVPGSGGASSAAGAPPRAATNAERCGGSGAGHGPDTRQSVQLRDRGLASFARGSHRARTGSDDTSSDGAHCHGTSLRPDGPPHPTLHCFSRLAAADPTAIHGETLSQWASELSVLYNKILRALQKLPESAAYRRYTEQIVKERLSLVESEKDIARLEHRIGDGQIEQVIKQTTGPEWDAALDQTARPLRRYVTSAERPTRVRLGPGRWHHRFGERERGAREASERDAGRRPSGLSRGAGGRLRGSSRVTASGRRRWWLVSCSPDSGRRRPAGKSSGRRHHADQSSPPEMGACSEALPHCSSHARAGVTRVARDNSRSRERGARGSGLPLTAAPAGQYPATNPFSGTPAGAKISFSSFKQGFTSTTNYLRRRFSSGDLSGELDDQPAAAGDAPANSPLGTRPELSLNLRPSSATSAPSSPARSGVSSLLSRGASLTGRVVGGGGSSAGGGKERQLTLLVVDDAHTDWAKHFRGRKVHGEWDVRVEQAEFKDLSLWSSSEAGATVSMAAMRQGTKVVRSFRPDMVLVRQHVRDGPRDERPFLLGLRLGGVPAVNSLHSLYNFQDKPWVFAQLQSVQRRLGRDNFPLMEQSFFPNHADMLAASKFPCVVKVGHAHGGLGKVRVQSQQELQDVAGLVALAGGYCVVEPFVEAKCDLHVQKIGAAYKCFVRKSISGHWKANVGSAMLEQVPLADRHKVWVDAVSEIFGGLDICAVEAIQAKDGREFITEANDSAMQLLGESQEEDRRLIADLVLQRMQQYCRPPQQLGGAPPAPAAAAAVASAGAAPPVAATQEGPPRGTVRPRRESQGDKTEDPDDTMRNLRKTFAGVFGDM
ncbi:hypothetical protein HPB48_006417 [Haemaphysalis longicornis]|uniref:ATP-grasp domain-containing protein n=1 Tax=Haemaphysalis longicornis TaxID=44386 RepID=A0A9J6FKI4_HAELO|nr:hypothetical protein HPB48_006417 [Haemaphysalis longicornis]